MSMPDGIDVMSGLPTNGKVPGAAERFPERFFFCYEADPNQGMDEVRKIVRLHEGWGLKAISGFPSGRCPQVPINDARWYPIYCQVRRARRTRGTRSLRARRRTVGDRERDGLPRE